MKSYVKLKDGLVMEIDANSKGLVFHGYLQFSCNTKLYFREFGNYMIKGEWYRRCKEIYFLESKFKIDDIYRLHGNTTHKKLTRFAIDMGGSLPRILDKLRIAIDICKKYENDTRYEEWEEWRKLRDYP